MGKSLDFIKENLGYGGTERYESIEEENAYDMLIMLNFFNSIVPSKTLHFEHIDEDDKTFDVIVKYNPNVDFEYYVMDQCICGDSCDYFPFVIFQKLMYGCIDKITNLEFYGGIRSLPEDPNGCTITCTVGDFVLAKEISDEIPNDDETLMSVIYVAMLPMKFDVEKGEN